jgi:hypothetical protein
VIGHVALTVFTAGFAAAQLGIGFVGCHVALAILATGFAAARLAVRHLAVFAHGALIGAARTSTRFVANRGSSRGQLCHRLRHHRQRKQHGDCHYHQLRFHDFLVSM